MNLIWGLRLAALFIFRKIFEYHTIYMIEIYDRISLTRVVGNKES